MSISPVIRSDRSRIPGRILGWALGWFLFASPGFAQDQMLPNVFCPVLLTERAKPEFRVDFMGEPIYFCCADCVRRFSAAPDKYLKNLPERSEPRKKAEELQDAGSLTTRLMEFTDFCDARRGVLLYVTGVAAVGLFLLRWRRRLAARETPPNRVVRIVTAFGHPAVLLSFVLLGVTRELWVDREQARVETQRLKDERAANTAPMNIRNTAGLFAWAWPRGFQELPRGVKNTYYRGNDERNPMLFNGGNYRTATIDLALQTDDAKDVAIGESLKDRELRIHVAIRRAPGTSLGFFKATSMDGVFFYDASTGKSQIPLSPLQEDERWAADLPLGPAPNGDGYAARKGVWYLTVGPGGERELSKSIVHYAVQYALHFQDGVLLPESTVWMVPVLFSGILEGSQADSEWFSDRPIPEIQGENTRDPKLLGLPDAKK